MSKTLTMYFHAAGTVSEEEWNVIYENDDVIVLSDDEDLKLTKRKFLKLDFNEREFEDGTTYNIFDKNSGKCLNDSNFFGAYRTIKTI